MEDFQLERISVAMIEKYGQEALSKAVRAARRYTEEGKIETVRMWVAIGQRIREMLDDPAAFREAREKKESA
jgi:hypothetical protein